MRQPRVQSRDLTEVPRRKLTNLLSLCLAVRKRQLGQDAIAAREAYIKQNAYEVVDPIDIVGEIKGLEAWINEFETEVDSAIQVSNATHTITIDV